MPESQDSKNRKADSGAEDFRALFKRTQEIEAQGRGHGEAFGLALLEQRCRQWPSGWGDNLHILVFGDFKPPIRDLRFERLGIVIHHEPKKGTVVGEVFSALEATVDITEKSPTALAEAAGRINTLLGAWSLVTWGNAACHWWSYVTHGSPGGVLPDLDQERVESVANAVLELQPDVRRKIQAALYWTREPRTDFMRQSRHDVLAVYAGYWNAFECLVEAVNLLRPPKKLRRDEKQAAIASRLLERGEKFGQKDIQDLYLSVVNPGLRVEARAALLSAFGEDGERYLRECFLEKRDAKSLYQIRNDINHGNIDATQAETLLLVEDRLHRLWIIVWRLFARIVPFAAPADPPPGTTPLA